MSASTTSSNAAPPSTRPWLPEPHTPLPAPGTRMAHGPGGRHPGMSWTLPKPMLTAAVNNPDLTSGWAAEPKLSTGFCVVRRPSRTRPLCTGQGACIGQCRTARGRCPSRPAPWCCARSGAPTRGRPPPRSWPQPGGCRTRPRSPALCDLWGHLNPKVYQAAQLPWTRRDVTGVVATCRSGRSEVAVQELP